MIAAIDRRQSVVSRNAQIQTSSPSLQVCTLHLKLCSTVSHSLPLYFSLSTVVHCTPPTPEHPAKSTLHRTHRAQLLTFLPLSLFRRILVSSRCSCGGEEKTLRFECTLAIEIAHAWGLLVATIYIRATSDRDLGLLVEEEGQKKYISKIHVCAVLMK